MKRLMISLLVVLLCTTTYAKSWTKAVEQLAPSVASFAGTDPSHLTPDYCTVIIFAKGHGFIAGHCVLEAVKGNIHYNKDYTMTVNNKPATLLKYGEYEPEANIGTDIAILAWEPSKDEVPAKFSTMPLRIGTPVAVIGDGYGFGYQAQFGYVQQDHGHKDPFIFMNITLLPGDSGGPTINERGEVIGMTSSVFSKFDYAHFGISIPTEALFEFFYKEYDPRPTKPKDSK
jgi:Trypsin-like peptidase domain